MGAYISACFVWWLDPEARKYLTIVYSLSSGVNTGYISAARGLSLERVAVRWAATHPRALPLPTSLHGYVPRTAGGWREARFLWEIFANVYLASLQSQDTSSEVGDSITLGSNSCDGCEKEQ